MDKTYEFISITPMIPQPNKKRWLSDLPSGSAHNGQYRCKSLAVQKLVNMLNQCIISLIT